MPSPNALGGLGRALLLGGATIYGAANSLFNVEGGHRAIVFNRLSGIKDTVCSRKLLHRTRSAPPQIQPTGRRTPPLDSYDAGLSSLHAQQLITASFVFCAWQCYHVCTHAMAGMQSSTCAVVISGHRCTRKELTL